MENLSHWNAALSFTAEEAAALIVGVDALSPEYVRTKSKPVYDAYSVDRDRRFRPS